ncbi:MAG: hypothetical protein DDT31_01931 [Syntrophomonadaceae bacterium]|nr:hypothetical protein [Bacillota bacterium]
MDSGRVDLDLNNVIEPGTMLWYEEGDYVISIQERPRRDVILTKASRSIWQLVTDGNLTPQEIIEKLRDCFSEEHIMANLEMMVNIGLIRTKENFLWQEE